MTKARIPMREVTLLDDIVLDSGITTKKSLVAFPKYVQSPIERVALADLTVDHMYGPEQGYQRAINPICGKIYNNFDARYFMLALISRRTWENDRLVIIDGQNRLAAIRAGGVKYADCVVVEFDSLDEESEAFLVINTGRKALASTVVAVARHLTGNSPVDTRFLACVEKAGFILHEVGGHLRLKAARGLKISMNSYGDDNLTNALLAYKLIWPDHSKVIADVVRGLMFLIWAYRKDGKQQMVSATALAKNIDGIQLPFDVIPKYVNVTAHQFNTGDRDFRFAERIIKEYNRGLKGRSRLKIEVAVKALETTKR